MLGGLLPATGFQIPASILGQLHGPLLGITDALHVEAYYFFKIKLGVPSD
jgi:hypothetical protein